MVSSKENENTNSNSREQREQEEEDAFFATGCRRGTGNVNSQRETKGVLLRRGGA